jgi:Eco57I restriction-modification methylase
MLARLKFDFDKLAKEMIDQLPESLVINGTVLDPCIGGGQFVREIERRKRLAGKTDEEINQTVFGFEENALRRDYAVNRNNLVGTYSNKSFLSENPNMKFDVIIGNPPYQRPKADSRLGSRGDTSLWDKFVLKSLDVLKSDGYLAFIHPNSWRKPDDRNDFWKLLTKTNQMHKLVMSSGKRDLDWFGIGVRVDYYILEKTPRYKNTTVIDHESVTYDLDLSKFDWLPNYAINEISAMLGKDLKVLYNTFYHTQKTHCDTSTSKFKYPVVHTINQQGLGIKYFDRVPEPDVNIHHGVPKVLLNQNELQYPYNDYNGDYGMSQLTFGIPIDSKEEGDAIVKFLNSDVGKRIIAATKWNTYYTDYGMFNYFRKDFYK